jgi:hypothetical protein
LNRTSISVDLPFSLTVSILESQSKTVNLLHPSVPHVPLFLHPPGTPLELLLQLEQPIDDDCDLKNLKLGNLSC